MDFEKGKIEQENKGEKTGSRSGDQSTRVGRERKRENRKTRMKDTVIKITRWLE